MEKNMKYPQVASGLRSMFMGEIFGILTGIISGTTFIVLLIFSALINTKGLGVAAKEEPTYKRANPLVPAALALTLFGLIGSTLLTGKPGIVLQSVCSILSPVARVALACGIVLPTRKLLHENGRDDLADRSIPALAALGAGYALSEACSRLFAAGIWENAQLGLAAGSVLFLIAGGVIYVRYLSKAATAVEQIQKEN